MLFNYIFHHLGGLSNCIYVYLCCVLFTFFLTVVSLCIFCLYEYLFFTLYFKYMIVFIICYFLRKKVKLLISSFVKIIYLYYCNVLYPIEID